MPAYELRTIIRKGLTRFCRQWQRYHFFDALGESDPNARPTICERRGKTEREPSNSAPCLSIPPLRTMGQDQTDRLFQDVSPVDHPVILGVDDADGFIMLVANLFQIFI